MTRGVRTSRVRVRKIRKMAAANSASPSERELYNWMFENFIDFCRAKLTLEQVKKLNTLPTGPWGWFQHIQKQEGLETLEDVYGFAELLRMRFPYEMSAGDIIREINADVKALPRRRGRRRVQRCSTAKR